MTPAASNEVEQTSTAGQKQTQFPSRLVFTDGPTLGGNHYVGEELHQDILTYIRQGGGGDQIAPPAFEMACDLQK
jgi:hypothetical protein